MREAMDRAVYALNTTCLCLCVCAVIADAMFDNAAAASVTTLVALIAAGAALLLSMVRK